MKRIRNVSAEVQAMGEQLRHELTPAETVLWNALRGRQVENIKFRRQVPMGRFVLDFYAPSHQLVIEVDGSIHETQQERDQERAQILAAHGCRVLRFRNEDILTNLPAVLQQIRAHL